MSATEAPEGGPSQDNGAHRQSQRYQGTETTSPADDVAGVYVHPERGVCIVMGETEPEALEELGALLRWRNRRQAERRVARASEILARPALGAFRRSRS